MENIIPCSNIEFWNIVDVLLGSKLSGHSDTLTEAANFLGEIYEKGEIQNEQQYRNALDKFYTKQFELPSKIWEQTDFNAKSKIEKHMLIVME